MPRTSNLPRAIRGTLAFVSLLMLCAYLIGLVILLTLKPDLLSELKAAVSLVAGVAPVAIIIARLNKRLGNRLDRPGQTISGALRDFLVEEPLLLGMVWIFLAIGLVVASYFWPYYRITATVESGLEEIAYSELDLVGQPKSVPFSFDDSPPRFLCSKFFRWGDTLLVHVKGDDYLDAQSPVDWTGIPLFHVFSSKNVPISVKKSVAIVRVEGAPEETSIVAHIGDDPPRQLVNPDRLRLPLNTHLQLDLAAGDEFQTDTIRALVLGDTVISFDLDKKPGMLILRAKYRDGDELNGLDTYELKNGGWEELAGIELGTPMLMPAGSHKLKICDVRGDDTVIVSEIETVIVEAAQTVTHWCVIDRKSGSDCGF